MALLDDLTTGVNKAQEFLNNNTPLTQSQQEQFKSDGFALPATFSADGTGLPFSKVPNNRTAELKRNIMTWFIPDFGVVRMFVNPASLSITDRKLINKDRTKGGFTLSYWGEDLTAINISGTTGSSGIEGINVLHEIYRAEQFAFDSAGLMIAANNASADIVGNIAGGINDGINSLVNSGSSGLQALGVGLGVLGGVLGVDSPVNALAAKNIPSLAQLAFGVELYYNGVVYRGFFENMTVNERADNFLIEYQMTFTATQKRGYRTNYFPWSKSPKDGPSESTTPYSYNGHVTTG